MAFELQLGEPVGAGVRRIVDEQLAAALEELRGGDASKYDDAVHAARKRFKRVRALARLIRDELGEETFARENAAFRDAGATLSEARDAAVLVQTLDGLKDQLDPQAFTAARRKLLARRRLISRRVLHDGNGLETVARAAETARERVAGWTIHRDGWRAIRPGLKRIYGNGREAFKLADPGASAELFHEWRKQVKNLWHQLEVIEPLWPAVLRKLADECHALADALGRDHDLAVLREVLEAEATTHATGPSPVLPALDAARDQLQLEARSLGARIYAEKPNAFIRRLGKYWKAWDADAPTDDDACPQDSAAPTDADSTAAPADEPSGEQGGETVSERSSSRSTHGGSTGAVTPSEAAPASGNGVP